MQDGFYIGPLKIYYYAIIIILGVLAAIALSLKEIKRRNLNPELLWDMIPWLLVFGLIGARIWHVFTPSKSLGVGVDYYFSNPIQILNFRRGGLGIPGAILGGVLGLGIFAWKRKINFLTRNCMVRQAHFHGQFISHRKID
jgi:phosphatidylglycerol:prolipoprotein diacylglycerol transferase